MSNLTPIISDSFVQYAGAVLQSRALVDVRDCLKPSARQIFYCLYTDGFVHSKPFKKTLKAIGSAMRVYIHGDSSCEGVIMRAGQPFAMRYPLIEVEGSYGNLMESGNWAAPRYTASRLSELAEYLFTDIKKDTLDEWRINYDDTEYYPSVLTSKGFFNIVNGSYGIGIGMGSSIPQFNLKDVNRALINLINNPDCDFDDIYCVPDFATGAYLLNDAEVKESLKNGKGKACKLRSVVEYDSDERCFIVKEIPYGVYTNTICGELEKILNEDNPGIDRFNDLTGKTPEIKIYLLKNANPSRVLKYLYKNTSLQSHYSINLTMLKDGRFPKVFTWKEVLIEHINHEKIVYRRAFEYDLKKIKYRIHIIDGLLICMARIEEVIQTIKGASSTTDASIKLQTNFLLDEDQAKAVLDMKLARLAHLEVKKLEKEKSDLEVEASHIEEILSNEILFNQQLITNWENIANKFGDERRTKVLNIESEDDKEPIENKSLLVSLTNHNALYVSAVSSLYTQKRAGTGSKIKLSKDEYIVSSCKCETIDTVLLFTKKGFFYHYPAANFPLEEKFYLEDIGDDDICAIAGFNKNSPKHIIFFTKKSMIKKSLLSEYQVRRGNGSKALNLSDGDEIASICFCDEEDIGILTKKGFFVRTSSKDIRAIGRVAVGVKGVKLSNNDEIVAGRIIPKEATSIITISEDGYVNRTPIDEFSVSGRNTKGLCAQKTDSFLADFTTVNNENEIIIATNTSCIKFELSSINTTYTRAAKGVIGIKVKDNDKVIRILKN